MINNPLESNKISELLSMSIAGSQEQDVNYIFQVVQIKKNISKNVSSHKENCVVTLRDLNVKYGGFIFTKDQSDDNFQENDIINLTKIAIKLISNKKIFFVKSYSVLTQFNGNQLLLQEVPFYKEPQKEITVIYQKEDNDEVAIEYTPLKRLTTFSRDFIICARVIQKTEMKKFSNNSQSNGRLFSFDILDKDGTEMQVTCFNKAADKFFDIIEKDQIYEINGGYIKLNNQKYSSIKGEYKIVLDEKAKIRKKEDDGEIKKEVVNYVSIEDITKLQIYSVIDICGIALKVGEKTLIKTKNGDQYLKKIIVADQSKYKIELTLWRHNADLMINEGDIIYAHHVKIGDFNGRNISSTDSTYVEINPISDEAEKIGQFVNSYNGEYSSLEKVVDNKNSNINDSGDLYFLKDVLDNNFQLDNNKCALVRATITKLINNEKNFYMGCPNISCKKKIVKSEETDNYFCPGCNEKIEKPVYYYTLNLKVQDSTCDYWIDFFGKTAENLIKLPAEEYKDYVIQKNTTKLKEISDEIEFKEYIFYIKPKVQIFAGNTKKRLYAYKVEQVDKSLYNKLIKNIEKEMQQY